MRRAPFSAGLRVTALAGVLVLCACERDDPLQPYLDDQEIHHRQDVESCARQPELPWCPDAADH